MYTAVIDFKYYIFLYAHITLDERHHRMGGGGGGGVENVSSVSPCVS